MEWLFLRINHSDRFVYALGGPGRFTLSTQGPVPSSTCVGGEVGRGAWLDGAYVKPVNIASLPSKYSPKRCPDLNGPVQGSIPKTLMSESALARWLSGWSCLPPKPGLNSIPRSRGWGERPESCPPVLRSPQAWVWGPALYILYHGIAGLLGWFEEC